MLDLIRIFSADSWYKYIDGKISLYKGTEMKEKF